MKLTEISQPALILSPAQLAFLRAVCLGSKWSIDSDNLVNVDGTVQLSRFHDRGGELGESIPVAFGIVTGSFMADGCDTLKTMKGFPNTVKGEFSAYGCHNLTSIKGVPQYMNECDLRFSGLKNLSGIHEHIRQVRGIIRATPERAILGLLLVPCNGIVLERVPKQVVDMIWQESLLDPSERDIAAVQEKLIDMGYPEMAEL